MSSPNLQNVPSAVAEKMKIVPRKFNETLTDWAIRCRILMRFDTPSPQAKVGE